MTDTNDTLAAIDQLAFSVWISTGKGSPPDIGGEWYRYAGATATHYDAACLGKDHHTRRHADISVRADGRLEVTCSHGPDQIFRHSDHASAVEALRAGLLARQRWVDGEPCGKEGCRYGCV